MDDEALYRSLERAAAIEDLDADERWGIIRDIQDRTDRYAFDAAYALARSDETRKRVLGIDILAQIGVSANRPFNEDALPLLIEATEDVRPEVVAAVVMALGHIGDPRGLPAVLRRATHRSAQVRESVAVAIPQVAGDVPGADAVEALIQLSADPDLDVRDWATFGLGTQFEDDTQAIRDALAARLADGEGDTPDEALVGLARRHDPRVLPVLLARLDDDPGDLVVEAAAKLGAPERG
jgi:hypothetical protein